MATQEEYRELISIIENNFKTLDNATLDSLVREKDLGSHLNFKEARTTIIKIKELFKKARGVNFLEIPYNLLNQFNSALAEVLDRFGKIINFDPAQSNPVQQRNSLISDLEDRYEQIYERVLPILTSGLLNSNDLSLQQAKLDGLLESFEKKKVEDEKVINGYLTELNQTVSNAKAAAAEVGVSKHSEIFLTESKEHKKQAKIWLGFTIGILFLIVLAAILFLLYFPKSGSETTEIVQFTLTKLVVLSTLFYALSICNKNYKAHRHNALLNRHRHNALTTFETFSKAAGSDEQTKNAVLLEATRTIFSNQQTGYVTTDKESDSASKYIEIIKSVAKVDSK